jgi:hypothetical protein
VEDLTPSMSETIPVEIPLSIQAIRLLKAYATLSGKEATEVSAELGVAASAIFEEKLRAMVAGEIGMDLAAPVRATTKKLRPQPSFDEEIADLGDADIEDPQDIAPSEQVFSGGLTDKDLDDDMRVEDPLHEAKGEPLAVGPDVSADDIMAGALGFETSEYVDERILKRKKRFGKGKGIVKPLSEGVLAEGSGI